VGKEGMKWLLTVHSMLPSVACPHKVSRHCALRGGEGIPGREEWIQGRGGREVQQSM